MAAVALMRFEDWLAGGDPFVDDTSAVREVHLRIEHVDELLRSASNKACSYRSLTAENSFVLRRRFPIFHSSKSKASGTSRALRVSLSGSAELGRALARLGLPLGSDWSATWDAMRARVVEALTAVRQELRNSPSR
jgi:hypothetical protein